MKSSRLRRLLLASTAPALVFCSAAFAVDVTGERSTPVQTSTANNGAADNVTITSGATVRVTSGAAVTVDSSNSVTNAGTIAITDVDGAVGIRVLGGFTGTVDNNGNILIDENYTRTDQDGDGTLDGPFAQGSGRRGILIEGPAAFTGDVRNLSGTITVEGNQSRGVDLQAALTGALISRGTVQVVGDQSIAINVSGDVGAGIDLRGSASAVGEGSTGMLIAGDVTRGVTNGGTIRATGFQFSGFTNYFDPDTVPEGFEPAPLDGDDLKIGGPALAIGGDVAEGILNNGFVGGSDADDPETGADPAKDIKADFDEDRSPGSIISTGSAPAVVISPDYATDGTGDLVIGLVVERVRDTTDDDNDGDREEQIAQFLEAHGFVNRGAISANGLNIGFAAQGVVVSGSADGTRDAIIQGGILNAGQIAATAFEANATAMRLASGAQTARLDNTGQMTATVSTETNHTVTVLLIESGSFLQAISNDRGNIAATTRGDGGSAFAIRDLSGTLLTIDNTGAIVAAYLDDADDDDGDGRFGDPDERTGEVVAIDLSGHQAGQNVTIVQQFATPTTDTNNDDVIDQKDVPIPRIAGDVLLGAGDDSVQLLGGTAVGTMAFGDGVDTLVIDGASFTGGISDSDGQLTITVGDEGSMSLNQSGDVTVTSMTLADGSSSTYSIDLRGATPTAARVIASGGITIGGTAEIMPVIVGVGSLAATDIELLRAGGGLTLAGGQSIADNVTLATPFLFDATLSTVSDGSADSVVVTVRRRTADELGMSANQAAAYEPLVAALNADDELLVAVVNITEGDDFYSAYNQLLPEYSVSALQFAVGSVDGAIGAVGTRLDAVRGGRQGAGAAWIQEFGMFLDRESTLNDPGYRGNGFGMAAGLDRPFGPFYAVGLTFVGGASEIEEPTGFDTPLSVATAQLGAYAATNLGNLLFDVYAGAGADFFESERNIVVGSVTRTALGEWKAHHATATARVAYDFQRRWFFARPALSYDYFRMDEESYSESGGGAAIDLRLAERSSEISAATASMTFGARLGDMNRTWWSPRLRVGYRHENYGSPLLTTARYVTPGGDSFILAADQLPDSGGVFGFSFAAGSRYSSFALDYDADVRSGFVRHGVRVAFRFIF